MDPYRAQEARDAIIEFDKGLQETPPDEIERMIGRMATLYPAAKVSDAEAQQRLALYVELLKDIPLDILSHSFRKAAMTHKFFPAVSEIRDLAAAEVAQRCWRRFVLQRMVNRHESEWREPEPEEDRPTPEEVRAILRGAGIKEPDPEVEAKRAAGIAQESKRGARGATAPE